MPDEATARGAVDRIMRHRRRDRRLLVRANADTPRTPPAPAAWAPGHRPVPHRAHVPRRRRKQYVEKLILAETDETEEALGELLPLQRKDFIRILEVMDGLPVTIRLLDPPLHEFLPDLTELSVQGRVAEEQGTAQRGRPALLRAVRRLHESNPMLGLRGVRWASWCRVCSRCRCGRSLEAACFRQRSAATREPRS
jgi:pyruvate,orthophosphate dikinase